MKIRLLLMTFPGALSLPGSVLYTQDFEAAVALPAGWAGAGTITTTGGLSAFGFGAKHLFNGGTTASTLTLSGLLAHSTLTVNFDLALWDSVDSGSDFMTIRADGIDIISASVNIGNYANTGPAGDGPGTPITPNFVDSGNPNYGQNSGFRDSARRVSVTFNHTASSVVFSWAYPNSQTAPDESFGLDNITVSDANGATNGNVPEPGTFVLGASGLAALLAYRNRK